MFERARRSARERAYAGEPRTENLRRARWRGRASVVAAIVAAALAGTQGASAQVAFDVLDVSPERPFGEPLTEPQPNPGDSGGRVQGLVIDPRDVRVLYAAAQWSGV